MSSTEHPCFVWFEKKNNKRTGKTIAVIWDGDHRYVGESRCSRKDQFSRKIGRDIAIGRATHTMDVLTGKKDRVNCGWGYVLHKDDYVKVSEYYERIPAWMVFGPKSRKESAC